MRIVTWNLWWRFGPWEERSKAILTVLRELRPDVVGLQEVWGNGDDNFAARAAAELGLHWTWAPFEGGTGRWRQRADETGYGVGVAVLSRWPVAARAVAPLPPGVNDDGRVALHALLDAPERPVAFFTTHLEPVPSLSAVRCEQVRTLGAFVAAHRDATDFPPVVTGDHNAWPDSDEMRMLGGYKAPPSVPGLTLIDAWEFAEPGARPYTWDAQNPFATPRGDPSARIDYVHVGQPGPGGLGRVLSVARAGTAPVGGVWPSDHVAVVADLAEHADRPSPGRPRF